MNPHWRANGPPIVIPLGCNRRHNAAFGSLPPNNPMKPSLALALTTLFVSAPTFAAAPRIIPLWPDKAPGETAPLPPEADMATACGARQRQ
jgi:hypothetical protein